MKSNLRLSGILMLLILLSSCTDKKTTQPEDSAPTLPPKTSMVMGFDQFPDSSSVLNLPKTAATYSNWGWAAFNVSVWNSVLTLTLAVPVAAFFESFNHQPVLQPDGSWLWAYDVTVSGSVYSAKLFGLTATEGIQWRMLLSKEGTFTDFEWFTGLSNLPATEGNWLLNKNPENVTPFLSIDWTRNPQDSTGTIKYTEVDSGGFIYYGKTTGFPYDAFYQIFNSENSNETNIKWNIENRNGSVQDEMHFGDNDWHCWDENLQDIDCM